VGIRPGKRNAVIAGASKTAGGALVAAAALTSVEIGPGPISLDDALDMEHSGTGWALLALGVGIAGPMLMVESPSPETAAPETAVAAAGGGAADAA
jgi:hypothetical protein